MTPARSIRRPLALALAVLGSVGLLAGCGDGGDTSAAPAALSASEFRTQADAICKSANMSLDALGEPADEAALPGFIEKGMAITTTELGKLKALVPPAELKADFDAALALLDERQATLTDVAAKIAGGESAATVIAAVDAKMTKLQADARAKATALGLTECGKDDDEETTGGTETSASTGTIAGFAKDGTDVGEALQRYGTILQGIDQQSDFAGKRAELDAATDEIEATLEKMRGYTLADAALEAKRAAIVDKGQPLIDLMHELSEKGEKGSESELTDIATRFQAAAAALSTAVSG